MGDVLKALNDARIRSVVAGACGGFAGWLLGQMFVGEAASTWGTICVGLLAGVGIATILGSAEGIVVGSWPRALRGALIGLAVGALGGIVGAAFGQFSYNLATTPDQASATPGSPSSARSFFSPKMRQRFENAGALVGSIEIGLSWEDRNDLDLHVFDPLGEQISFSNKVARSGGKLDVDQNISPTTDGPVEHVVWEDRGPPGQYRVLVDFYQNHSGQPSTSAFKVEMVVDGKFTAFNDTIRVGQRMVPICEFELGDEPKPTSGFNFLELLAVILGWTVFGALIGIAEGVRRRSAIALRNSAIGGTIGGSLGGLALVLLAIGSPTLGRMLGFVTLGACIGLWIVLVDRALSAALSIRNGRFEGREIFLDKPLMRLGRSDALEVYLSGDTQIANHHASIRHEGGGHVIEAVGGAVLVNGTPISRQSLRAGDMVTIGVTRLAYKHRKTVERGAAEETPPSAAPRANRTAPPPPPPPPRPKKK